jgi:Rrf2 family nitric oxide-sensitive transcriptional repressor
LQRPPEKITIGEVVRSMENHFNWVECFDPEQKHCRLLPNCDLKHLLARAGDAYFKVLDAATLADLLLGTTLITPLHKASLENDFHISSGL